MCVLRLRFAVRFAIAIAMRFLSSTIFALCDAFYA
jgi:hypothetical protein